ncbi:Uncharacterised protein [Actinobacillus pleuropneumoniae]|nr:Uncharacterised protein [Actinobacillus pleuropneumoniae]
MSSSFPYCPANAIYSPPFEFVMAAMMARGARPRNNPLESANRMATKPNSAPIVHLNTSSVTPFPTDEPAVLNVICVPAINKKRAMSVLELFTNKASVNPPIRKAFGANVLMHAPMRRGTTIIPPGIRSNVALIFIMLAPCVIVLLKRLQ